MKKAFLILMFLSLIIGFDASGKRTTNYREALVLAYSPVNSIFEDDNIILQIYDEQLWAINKTKKTIFIDLSQCFLINNGSSYPMFDKHADEKTGSKKNYSTSIDEFLSIAPATGNSQNPTFICNIGQPLYGKYSTSETPTGNFSDYEKRFISLIDEMLNESLEADPKHKNYLGTVTRHLTEDESVSNIGASIAYAFNKRAEDWTSVIISTWVSDITFAPFFIELPKELSKKEKRGFGVKEQEAAKIHIKGNSPFAFEEDKSPIIVADWEGDYKKGEFYLRPVYALKSKSNIVKKISAGLFTWGMGALLVPSEETRYKTIIIYDGTNKNWGKMNKVKKIENTGVKAE